MVLSIFAKVVFYNKKNIERCVTIRGLGKTGRGQNNVFPRNRQKRSFLKGRGIKEIHEAYRVPQSYLLIYHYVLHYFLMIRSLPLCHHRLENTDLIKIK